MKTSNAILVICSFLILSCKDQGTQPSANNTFFGWVDLYNEYGDTLVDRSNVVVTVENTSITTLSDSTGEWNLSNVPVGELSLDFSKAGFGTYVQHHVIYSGGITKHSTLEIPLVQSPTYKVDSISMTLSVVDSSITVHGSVSALSKSSHGKTVVLYFGNGPTISSQPNEFSFLVEVNIQYGVLTFSKSISINDLGDHGLRSGQKLLCVAYPSAEGAMFCYNDPLTGRLVVTSISQVPSNVVNIVVP